MELNKNDYGQVITTIGKHKSIDYVPLAEELEDSPNERKLSSNCCTLQKRISAIGSICITSQLH